MTYTHDQVSTVKSALNQVKLRGAESGFNDVQLRLLEYLIDEELAGRGDRIKAYSIAIDVLGKNTDFDPAQSSAVRVQMHRLRNNLEQYNAISEMTGIRIEIPKGSYRPLFTGHDRNNSEEQVTSTADRRTSPSWLSLPVLLGTIGMLIAAIAIMANPAIRERPGQASQAPERLSVSVLISIDTENETDQLHRFLEDAKQIVTQRAYENYFIRTVTTVPYDYRLSLSAHDPQLAETAHPIYVRLYSNDGQIRYQRSYEITEFDEQNLKGIVSNILYDFFTTVSVTARVHAMRPGNSAMHNLYRCVYDSFLPLFGRPQEYYTAKEINECLEPEVATLEADISRIYLRRANISLMQLYGHDDYGFDGHIDEVIRNLELARRYAASADEVLPDYVYTEIYRPDFDVDRLRKLLAQLEASKLVDRYDVVLLIYVTYTYYLGEQPPAITRALLSPEECAVACFMYFAEYFMQDLFDEAYEVVHNKQAIVLPHHVIYARITACATGNEGALAETATLIREHHAFSDMTPSEFLQTKLHYHDALKTKMLDVLGSPECAV